MVYLGAFNGCTRTGIFETSMFTSTCTGKLSSSGSSRNAHRRRPHLHSPDQAEQVNLEDGDQPMI